MAGKTENGTGLNSVIPELYNRLHEIAARQMSRERTGHLLQTTAVVHEAWFRLAREKSESWSDRNGFLAAAANVMRRVLIDHSRREKSQRQGGGFQRQPLEETFLAIDDQAFAAVDLHDALERLASFGPLESQALELMIFAGMTGKEIAGALNVSQSTIDRKIRTAKAWLQAELAGRESNAS